MADWAMRAYDIVTLRRVVKILADLLAQMVRDPGESAPQADETARQWNRR